MQVTVSHPTYGIITYDEGFWTGKKTLTVNGVDAQSISKKEYMINGKKALLKGNYFTGINLYIEGEPVRLSPKPKWYEIFFAIFPLVFLLTWGNSASLCAIFPVVGGAIGGALGGIGAVMSLFFMKKQKTLLAKVLMGIGVAAATVFVAFILAVAMFVATGTLYLSQAKRSFFSISSCSESPTVGRVSLK